jgi:hypothetical protein
MIGEQLYLQNRRNLEGALDCTTKEKYDHHVAAAYEGLKAFPNHVTYFKKFFDDPASIAKYSLSAMRGGLCTITSAAAEQTHSSNERAVPTKLFGLVTPERQMLELTRRADNWIRRDLEEKTLMELHQQLQCAQLIAESPEHKAIMSLYRHPFKKMFMSAWIRKDEYDTVVFGDVEKGQHGKEVIHVATGKVSSTILHGGRCNRKHCIAMDSPCVHELCVDGDFILEKWGTRWWNDRKYKSMFGEKYHARQKEGTGLTHNIATDNSAVLLDPIMGATDASDATKSPRGSGSKQCTKAYSELMQSFSGLAADLSRIPHMCEIWLGMVQCAKNIVRETPKKTCKQKC